MTFPHSRDLRKGRWSEPGRIYLVTTRAVAERAVLNHLFCARAVVKAMHWHDEVGNSATWAFVVMPDHLHWLFELKGGGDLSNVVGRVKSYSSRLVNQMTGSSGPLWQPGFHDRALRAEEDLRAVARYVVMNPVRAGLAKSPRQYGHWDARWIG
jgi:REP element-mobilizing transposase RayT